ncbi:MAG: phenylalanine--tRNA ligase subunit alpha, partial [Bacteroidota bacterium]
MNDKIEELINEVESFQSEKLQDIEDFRIKMISKKGKISQLFQEFKELPSEKKKEVGQKINVLKNKAV